MSLFGPTTMEERTEEQIQAMYIKHEDRTPEEKAAAKKRARELRAQLEEMLGVSIPTVMVRFRYQSGEWSEPMEMIYGKGLEYDPRFQIVQ